MQHWDIWNIQCPLGTESLENSGVAASIHDQPPPNACDLLESHTVCKISIAAIAYQCVFNELAYFSRAFKRFLGLSPLACRNRT
ncbi:helix-turn-helix domain-containing protein [Acidithiobacillus ferrivorans]|uniref:helix-turn-helix domain-containing protein n=1 Tax=Acidithiobacillus ferrivorans TaxID=160808 RepID=UPI0035216D46